MPQVHIILANLLHFERRAGLRDIDTVRLRSHNDRVKERACESTHVIHGLKGHSLYVSRLLDDPAKAV